MDLRKWVLISMLLGSLVCFMVVSSCSKEVENEQKQAEQIIELKNKVKEQQKIIDQYQADQKKREREEQNTVEVSVIDPNSGKTIKIFKPIEMGYDKNAVEYKKRIKAWVKDLARSENGYDKKMFPDKLGTDGHIIKGTPRIILSEEELVKEIMDASEKGGQVKLPLQIFESGYKLEEVNTLDEKVVSSYMTRFDPSLSGRARNIELSAQAIHNTIIGVGDIFSFNITVGQRTKARGYQEAPEIVDKKLVKGIGGGICQTSSTLYNAVDPLKVKYIEHYHHSLHVGYVPLGRDATVSWGGPDFRFQNTLSVPLLVTTSVNKVKGTVTVEVRTSNKYAKQIRKVNGHSY